MKPSLGVFIGDLQCGGRTALGIDGYGLEGKAPYSLTQDQWWLHQCYQDALARVKVYAVGHQVFVGLGGDLVEGINHHGSTQTSGIPSTQAGMASELLLPYATMADALYAVRGTDDHTGPEGDGDNSVARELGAKIDYHWLLNVGGKVLDWAHHGISVAQNPASEINGMKLAADKIYWWNKDNDQPIPNTLIRHHAHRSPRPIEWRGIRVAVCGCWQLSTSFGYKIAGGLPPSIGLLVWWPETNIVERIKYDIPRPIEGVRYRVVGPAGTPTSQEDTPPTQD